MQKVLVISTVGLIYDGITSVILANLQAMDRAGLDIYIASTVKEEPQIRKQFESIGCKIVKFADRKKETFKYFNQLKKFIEKNHIDVIHANGNSATLAVEMMAAKLGGCKKRIAHSHNTRCDHVKADKFLRPFFYSTYTDALACSKDAGRWLFGNRPFTIIKNGRNINKFKFNISVRKSMRESLNIGDNIAIGHVGGFVPQKNHPFLLKIYKEIIDINPNAKLFMIGDGHLKPEIEQQAQELGIQNKIVFTGNINNVQDYLQAMDVMILPSLFEGLPLVVIEWQIAGIPCLLSDTITTDCAITDLVNYKSLNDSPYVWAEEALSLKVDDENRVRNSSDYNTKIGKAGFDIRKNASQLKKIYLQ